jgi:trk system potassium uptake protein TrkH
MIVPADEITRVVSLFFAWLVYVFGAGVITLLFSSHGLLGSFSAPLSMVGNMGPTFLPPGATAALHPAVKILYIIGMLAGRLEILPVLLFLTPRAWR